MEFEMKETYHVCTDGLSRNIIFHNDTDYINGMNAIPVCALAYRVDVLCFCLMSNHVHFIVRGNYEKTLSFIKLYKKRVNLGPSGYNAAVSLKRIDSCQYLMTAIAYVLRNPLAAGIRVTPSGYPWSSGNLYFSHTKDAATLHARRISQLKNCNVRTLLKTRLRLPEDYLIDENDMILPINYVDFTFVENLYGTPKRYLYYLSKNDDLEMELTTDLLQKAKYSDNELYNSILALCVSQFRKTNISELSIEEKLELAKSVHKKYRADSKQISRLTGLDIALLRNCL